MVVEPLTPERRRQQTREHLLEAAAQVFGRRGFHGASLDEVAAAAGFSKGAVYSNFKNKDDLVLALFDHRYRQQMVAVQRVLAASEVPAEERLPDFVKLVMDQMLEQPEGWGALYMEFCLYATRNGHARRKLAELDRLERQAIARILEGEIARVGRMADTPVETLAAIIAALFNGIGLMGTTDPDSVDKGLIEATMSFVRSALIPGDPVSPTAGGQAATPSTVPG